MHRSSSSQQQHVGNGCQTPAHPPLRRRWRSLEAVSDPAASRRPARSGGLGSSCRGRPCIACSASWSAPGWWCATRRGSAIPSARGLAKLSFATLRSLNQAAPIRVDPARSGRGDRRNLQHRRARRPRLRLRAAHRMRLAVAPAHGDRQPHGRAHRLRRQGAARQSRCEVGSAPVAQPQAGTGHVAHARPDRPARSRIGEHPRTAALR